MGAELPYQICEIGSICRMWRNTQNAHLPCSPISIHIFLAEGDDVQYQITELTKISIHTFLTEGDRLPRRHYHVSANFNPHLPCGRWLIHFASFFMIAHFNPHLPCGRWPKAKVLLQPQADFNPHLPCGRWRNQDRYYNDFWRFQSTPSLRKVTIK